MPPLYGNCVNFNIAAAECIIGIETLDITLPTIKASFRVHADSASGNNRPLKNAAGL